MTLVPGTNQPVRRTANSESPFAPGGDAPVDERDIRMPRRPYRPLALSTGALALLLCLIRPAPADPSEDHPSDADIVIPASAPTAEALSQRDFVATASTRLTAEFNIRAFDVQLFEASLPRDIPAPAGNEPAAATLAAASLDEVKPPLESAAGFDTRDFDIELFEAGLPREIPAPAGNDAAAATSATASSDEGKPSLKSTTEFETCDFDVELFEASLPRDISAPAGHDPAAATFAAASSDEGKPSLKSAVDHPRNKPPAAKQPLRSSMIRGKTNHPARAALPATRKVAVAPSATIPHARPRAAKRDHGPRELFIGRVPSSDRDEVMPALRLIPVMRVWLPPPPALALK
jgi:hypothetical protein